MTADQLNRIEEQLNALRGDVKTLSHHVTGNGNPDRGLILRLDRIEQREKTRSKYVGAALLAGISALVHAGWKVLASK